MSSLSIMHSKIIDEEDVETIENLFDVFYIKYWNHDKAVEQSGYY